MAAGCRAGAAKDERRDANVEKSISITTGPLPSDVVVGATTTSHQPRLRHSNYVMRRDDDDAAAADAAVGEHDDISACGGHRHLFRLL